MFLFLYCVEWGVKLYSLTYGADSMGRHRHYGVKNLHGVGKLMLMSDGLPAAESPVSTVETSARVEFFLQLLNN